MFNKLFKKTKDKVEDAIDNVANDTKIVMNNANELIDQSKDKLKIIIYCVAAGFAINIISNLLTIYCCNKVVKSVNRNDVLNDIAKILRNNKH